MKRLSFLRHTDTAAGTVMDGDHGRPLTNQGYEDALYIGRYLAEKGWLPQVILVSDARRTMETAKYVLEGAASVDASAANAVLLKPEPRLYLCARGDMMTCVNALEDVYDSALIIGHFPAIQEASIAMVGHDEDHLAAGMSGPFPTGALARFEVDAAQWSAVALRTGNLRDYTHPLLLR